MQQVHLTREATAQSIHLLFETFSKPYPPKSSEYWSMADKRKVKEANAYVEKQKFDQSNSVDGTFEQTTEVKNGESESSKRNKLETLSEYETKVIHSFFIGGKMVGTDDGDVDPDIRKVEEGNDETFEQTVEVKNGESESSKRQKLETPSENETEVIHSFLIDGKIVDTDDGDVDPKDAEGNNKDEHLNVEPEIVERRRRYTMEEKGKAVLIEESDEEEYDYYEDDSSSDDSNSDFSDGLDSKSESEDIPFLGVA